MTIKVNRILKQVQDYYIIGHSGGRCLQHSPGWMAKDRRIMWLYDRVLARFGRPITPMHLHTHMRTHPHFCQEKQINQDKTNCHKGFFLKKDSLFVQGGSGTHL